jgi:CheY-like chemotaxis protein
MYSTLLQELVGQRPMVRLERLPYHFKSPPQETTIIAGTRFAAAPLRDTFNVMNSFISNSKDSDSVVQQERIRVMLVEDSLLIREALIDALASSPVANFDGFASTAADAITVLRARQFDIVVVDIELAQGTGFDVLKNINQTDFPYPRPISMVLTNHAYLVYQHLAQLLGVKYFFDKSMHFNEAIETIEEEATRLLSGKA